ncbi:condensation domain-containing protein [Streptacidiphilus cavernicola]|uniref:Condensation domain-containing protein n=1 Tax=Streptacidiphilus cavernicola TaxID=3342716 RepID=A0ABV6VPJ7_9ACTN
MAGQDTGPVPVPPVAERVPVDFAGDGAGVDEMSWGMWEIWHAMSGQNSALPIGGRIPLAAGTTVADVAEELRYLMTRFPSMRTRLRFDAAGRPTQELFGSGRTALEVYDAEDSGDTGDADPDQVALAVELRYRATGFDYTADWPVRMAVVRQRGLPTHLVTIMDHLVTDAIGAVTMLRQVKQRDTSPVTGMQQLEQARWQHSPAGRRQNDKALRHWEQVLRAIPARRLPDSADPREPRHWSAEFSSPALRAALPVIADRTDADMATVMLSVFAVALNRITGINPVVVRPVVNNRFRPGLAEVVCMVAQAGVCVLDVADAGVDQVVERARRGTMSAYKYAYFHPEQLRELIGRVSAERGEEVDVACFFNDRGMYRRSPDDLALAGDELQQALEKLRGDTVFRWTARHEDPVERLYVSVDDSPGSLLIEIHLDTHFLSPADTEALARGMEAVAVAAALDPAGTAVG